MRVSTVFFCVRLEGLQEKELASSASQKAHLHPQPGERVDANQLARSAALSLAPNRQGILAYKRLLFISRSLPELCRRSPVRPLS